MGASPTTHERRFVLVVDDNRDAADSLAEWLRHTGHHVEVAYSGLSALAVRRESARPIRLVAHSGYSRPEEVSRCIECGFDAHVAKPAPPQYIERVLSGGSVQRLG